MTSPGIPKPIPAPAALPPSPPLLLTIRFSASLPDLELDIPHPGSTTIVSLKHLIRARLDKQNARRRLRFIHGGKVLPETAVLSAVLRAHPPPPPSVYDQRRRASDEIRGKVDQKRGDGKGKGKSVPGRPPAQPRIYVNCSIGDELTASELESEARAAAVPAPTLQYQTQLHPNSNQHAPSLGANTTTSTITGGVGGVAAAPRGFDRLRAAGFTASEVNQLRLQFRGIHASRYTPDTLPSPDSFRRMEDAWIDDNSNTLTTSSNPSTTTDPNTLGGGGGGGMLGLGGGGGDSDETGMVGMVDVLIRGVITGFLWPLGSAGWLLHEEGMSSDRWRFMVGVGVLFGVLIGFIRAISGDK
ncbi:DUF2407 C-terminal domain-containing protein [Nemania sp. FL0916]|nr:DUF2407 C-terminal domain-containing protein [Nemania sp. FL0916]